MSIFPLKKKAPPGEVYKSQLTFDPGMHLDRFSAKGALYAKAGCPNPTSEVPNGPGVEWLALDWGEHGSI